MGCAHCCCCGCGSCSSSSFDFLFLEPLGLPLPRLLSMGDTGGGSGGVLEAEYPKVAGLMAATGLIAAAELLPGERGGLIICTNQGNFNCLNYNQLIDHSANIFKMYSRNNTLANCCYWFLSKNRNLAVTSQA